MDEEISSFSKPPMKNPQPQTKGLPVSGFQPLLGQPLFILISLFSITGLGVNEYMNLVVN
ncbi:hypothetical protein FY534_13405 [Alicyclobacillus sp. TC]|nr:hypothetical protein FY534_13405 [Alicyclobacillus sp. TC]